MNGVRKVVLATAAEDVRAALDGLPQADQVGVLVGVLTALGQHSGDVPVFLALVQQTVRERLARAVTQ